MLSHSPRIITDGMVLCLDAANPKNYNLTEVEVLVVAGGGGGGVCYGGGGGGGGVIYNRNFAVTPGSALTVTVGNGGTNQVNTSGNGGNGGNSVFGSLTAIGGGYGGGNCGNVGGNGGSGGGGSGTGGSSTSAGTGTSQQGTSGGTSPIDGGGGGGGAGSSGSIRQGGNGLGFNISGTFTYYGGGGSGGGFSSLSGGIGGGGLGGIALAPGVADATVNTGGGGGGSIISGGTGSSGNGGSGIVIVRYPGPQKAIGGTVTSVAGHTIHTFTTVGSTTFTPLVATNNSAILGLSDFSGNGNFGTTANSPTYSSANGGSIVFDGTNDYISIPSTINFNFGSGDFSVECICFFDSSTSSDDTYRSILNIGSNPNYLQIIKWRSGIGNGIVVDYNVSGNRYCITTTNEIPSPSVSATVTSPLYDVVNKWSHITITVISNIMNLYINSVFYGSVTLGSRWNQNQNLSIGGITNSYMKGLIPVVKFYKNKGLTASEIQQNFQALRGRFGV